MFTLSFSGRFSRDVKTIVKRGYDVDILKQAIRYLEGTGTLPGKINPTNSQATMPVIGKHT